MSNSVVANVYRYVIDDVINQVRGDFEDMGVDDSVLHELQRSWEAKVARSRVANFGFSSDTYYDEGEEDHGDNVLNTNSHGYGTEVKPEDFSHHTAAANLASLATAGVRRPDNSIPPPSSLPPHSQQTFALPTRLPPVNNNGQYMMQPQQSPSLPDMHLPGRHNLPQNDGAHDSMTTEEIDAELERAIMEAHGGSDVEEDGEALSFSASSLSGEAIALDSLPDHVKLLIQDAKDRAVRARALGSRSKIGQLDGDDDNGDDDINSDLDDSDDDGDDAEGSEEIEHIILCLYDKVTRTKNKWKCVLKDGIMLINGRDYLFHRANGDFEW
ncbi:transcription factor IIA, alpha/beta subunit [Hesseltinella vesiculosa]|uniref:Transcription initiation factor IIA large subunit n=1 Tax=Hesseltinella vesiculosa TaxID=101127 RepID=A0A1X2GY00_9FUNG|nr:transcription factor IIA, alpha/beta subunit [Hesseltinella vesiculosa]